MGAAVSAAVKKKPCGADVLQAQPNWLKTQVLSCLPAPEPDSEPLSRATVLRKRASCPGAARAAHAFIIATKD